MLTNPTAGRRLSGRLMVLATVVVALPLTATRAVNYVDLPVPATPPSSTVPVLAAAQPAPVPAPLESDARGGSAVPALAITAGALGLVGMGIGVGFGIAAKNRLDVSRRYCDDNSCTTVRGVEAARSAGRAADVATIGFVAGGGLLALGTVLWLVADDEEESRRSRELRWTPSLAPGEVSLALSGSFAGP